MPPRATRRPNDHASAASSVQRPELPMNTDDDSFEDMPKEKCIQLAIIAVESKTMSERKAAIYYDVPRTTVQNRAKGMLIRMEAHAYRRNLSQPQENMLAEWVKVRTCSRLP